MPFGSLVQLAENPWSSAVARAVLVAAVPEETAKVTLIALLIARLRAVHEPMDGLVYGAAVGLGFAAWENLGYLVYAGDDWQTLAIMRSVLTVPFHGALGMIAGAYLAAARFAGALGAHRHGRWTSAGLIVSAWLVPVVLHASFDFPVLALGGGLGEGGLALQVASLVVGFGTLALAVLLARRLAAHQRTLSV
jgi:RsiW-degrading membrane proteinase PrsW (M82 family)